MLQPNEGEHFNVTLRHPCVPKTLVLTSSPPVRNSHGGLSPWAPASIIVPSSSRSSLESPDYSPLLHPRPCHFFFPRKILLSSGRKALLLGQVRLIAYLTAMPTFFIASKTPLLGVEYWMFYPLFMQSHLCSLPRSAPVFPENHLGTTKEDH